ncbi:hypothetical protein LXM25_12105 [Dyadobacter sp. LJ53]|uniref:hypothetical protein n=1 Tax=Dyadobacter chenwenxiniae TaxID=2906456 RepID=UPI001F3D649B|nr:hypothetical protein [Dyadobacter chenwenxiniae]MCF0050806.1 hypothetical protein [Dyadobacter chenwenxiniae]
MQQRHILHTVRIGNILYLHHSLFDRPIQTTNPIASFESQSKPAPAGGTLRSRANDLSNFDYKGPENEPPF